VKLSPASYGRLFVFQVAFNIIVLSFIIAQLILATSHIQQIQRDQIHYVQDQNTLSLCAQREILVAVRGIGRKLGLPVEDIVAPKVDPVFCEALSAEVVGPPYPEETP